MKTLKILQEVVNPLFETSLNLWVNRGCIFESLNGKKLAIYEDLTVFGNLTRFPQMQSRWKLYCLNEDGKVETITHNDINVDSSSLISDHQKSDREKYGLSIEAILEIKEFVSVLKLNSRQCEDIVTQKIQTLLKDEIFLITEQMLNIDSLNPKQLKDLMQSIIILSKKIKDFYPRSYEKLMELTPIIRDKYAQIKYPELYAELKMFNIDKDYKSDLDDSLIGFGPNKLFAGLFYKYFGPLIMSSDFKQLSSPFEEKWYKPSVFFAEDSSI